MKERLTLLKKKKKSFKVQWFEKVFGQPHAFAMYCIRNHCCVSKSNFFTHNPHVTFCTHTESIAHTKVQNKKKNISCKIMIEIVLRFLNKIMDDKESLPAVLFLLRGKTVIWMFYWYCSNCWLARDTFCSVWKCHTAKKSNTSPPSFLSTRPTLLKIFAPRTNASANQDSRAERTASPTTTARLPQTNWEMLLQVNSLQGAAPQSSGEEKRKLNHP